MGLGLAAPMPPTSPPPWTVESEQELLDLRILQLRRVRARSRLRPDHASDFVVFDAPDWVNVIALTPDERVVLVEQYRHGTRAVTVEIPGGMVDPGEDFIAAAVRELAEETGFVGASAVQIGVVDPNPAIQSNRCGTVLVTGAQQTQAPDLDPNEEIAVRTVPLSEMGTLLSDGTITHSLVVAAFHHLHLWRGR